ncbi:Uncharacterized protein FWK35_00004648 [Aphis craccivora]|uniref:Uncharacterized protein n=1 Tax=Aphis craccivora TaxID=307492 RepID=A0A6G0ZDY1_APHCR|nr:Uncharacterized protein FWK35_00004648 [Aphis craccivora]
MYILNTDKEPDPPIQLRETKKSLEILRIFFLQRGNEGSLINDLDACSDKIRQQSIIKYLCYVLIIIKIFACHGFAISDPNHPP